MCIQTKIQQKIQQKAELDAQIAKLEQLELKTSPVKALLAELLADYADEAPEDLVAIWQEVLAIGGQHNLAVQPLAADELRQWESTNAENEKLKAELEKEKYNYQAMIAIDRVLNQKLEEVERQLAELRSQLQQVQTTSEVLQNLTERALKLDRYCTQCVESDNFAGFVQKIQHIVTGNELSPDQQIETQVLTEEKSAIRQELENLYQEALVEPEYESKEATATVESVLKSHGFFMPDINLGDCYSSVQKYEDYRGWEIYRSCQGKGIDGIGLYAEQFGFWDVSTEMIDEDDPTFPQDFTDGDGILAWTRKVIDEVIAATPIENLEAPGQLALEFPETDEEIPELGRNWEIESKVTPDEPTKLQKLLEGTNNYAFNKLGAKVKIDSEFTENNHGEEPEIEENALFTVTDLGGGKVQHYYHSAEDLTEQKPVAGWNPLGNLMNLAEKYAKKWAKEQSLDTKPAEVETETKDDEYETILITFQGREWLVEVLNEFVSCITILIQTKNREEGFTATVARKDVENNDCSLAKCAEQVLNERLATQKQTQTTPEPIAEKADATKTETETNFEAMGYTVQVYPQYANEELTGATFRFLNSEHTLVFDSSRTATEIGDRPYKTIAWELIQDYRDKEAARLEKLANPHKKPEDDFIELVKLTPAVGYIKRRDNGELISAYAAFANRDAAGEKTATLAKPRAKKWAEHLHASFESCGWKVEQPRTVKRMLAESGAKQQFAYEIKIGGKFSIGQLQLLAEEDFSLLPNEVAAIKVPAALPTTAAPICSVKVNGYEVATGSEEEMRVRFEEELKTFGEEGRDAIRLVRGNEIIDEWYLSEFAFVPAQDFDETNPEYWTLHTPTKTNFRVYRSLASGAAWVNSVYPYSALSTKEAAAVDAVRRQLKAGKTE